MSLAQILFGFKGRLARLPYLGYSVLMMLFVGAIFVASFTIDRLAMDQTATMSGGSRTMALILLLLGFVAMAWMGMALAAKRLHDLGMSGLHLIWIYGIAAAGGALSTVNPTLSILFSIGNFCIALWLVFGPGQVEANRFGPAPGQSGPARSPSLSLAK